MALPHSKPFLYAGLLLLTAPWFGCNRPVAEIRIETSWGEEAITDVLPHQVTAQALDERGRPLSGVHFFRTIRPDSIVRGVRPDSIRCLATGLGSIQFSVLRVRQSVPITCALVASMEAPDSLRLVAGEEGMGVRVSVLDERGAPNPYARPTGTPSDTAIVTLRGDMVVGLSLGLAEIQWRFQDAEARTRVVVGREVLLQTLSIPDGTSELLLLPPGRHEIQIELRAGGGVLHGATVDWIVGSCPALPEARSHLFECQLDDVATLQITNPSRLGLGPSLSGWIRVIELPG